MRTTCFNKKYTTLPGSNHRKQIYSGRNYVPTKELLPMVPFILEEMYFSAK